MDNENKIIIKSEEDKLSDIDNKINCIMNQLDALNDDAFNNNSMPIPVDMRYATSIMMMNDEYYGLFANMKNAIEYVPYLIIEKGIKASIKAYKKSLKQLNREYNKILKSENAESRKKESN